jgi:integrase
MERKEPRRARIGLDDVRDIKPGELLWDTGVIGFCARRQRGPGITYCVFYRSAGRQRWMTIGRHGAPWTPDMARKKAREILGDAARGADPAAAKQAARKAITVAELGERFLIEHAEAKRKASTAKEYRRLLEHIVLPAIGKHKVANLTRQDIADFHHARRRTPTEANRALAVTTTLFNFAEKLGERPDGSNPCRHIATYPQKRRERFLSPAELARLGDALAAYCGSPYVVAAIKLLLFTGARLGEVLGLQWQWIDFDRGEARLPDSKTGAKTLHLAPPALAVLSLVPRVAGNPHVVVGGRDGRALVNLEKPWGAIRKAAGLEDVRLHDLRHSFASIAASNGMGLLIIGKMLGHTQAQTTQRYAHLAADPVKAAAAAVAGEIEAAMGDRRPG